MENKHPGEWVGFKGDETRRRVLFFWKNEWILERFVYRLKSFALFEIVKMVGTLAIIIPAITYVIEREDRTEWRRKTQIFQAWQVINTAAGKGGSGGVYEAMKDLAKLDEGLSGINLENAWLYEKQLSDLNFSRANFAGAILRKAELRDSHFVGADMRGADLQAAFLEGSDFTEADLRNAVLGWAVADYANFERANLENANLKEAVLTNAFLLSTNFSGANLVSTNFEEALLVGATLLDADVAGADFRGVRGLECAQLKSAVNWDTSYRDEKLSCGSTIPSPPRIGIE